MEKHDLVAGAAKILKQNAQTVAVAESTTGGLISAQLLAEAGASAYYLGGTVLYTRASRKLLLNVTAERLEGIRPMTEEMAALFAALIRERLGADWGIAELGIAGPTGSAYGVDAGTSVIAVSGPVSESLLVRTGHSDRVRNMVDFTGAALELFVSCLGQAD